MRNSFRPQQEAAARQADLGSPCAFNDRLKLHAAISKPIKTRRKPFYSGIYQVF